jgi:AcrR family transcriptional regulator
MTDQGPEASARQLELLEAAYRYALQHGIADLSLRPLAAAVGSSPRVLLYLFGSKDGLVRALLARARADELDTIQRLRVGRAGDGAGLAETGLAETGLAETGLAETVAEVWTWLAAESHRPLSTLWLEGYARSLIDPDGTWAGFARATVEDWLEVLAEAQPPTERHSVEGLERRTLALAVLRGALIDLLATGDLDRTTAAVHRHLAMLRR